MSPEIKVNGVVIADVPDESRWYTANDGSQLLVDVSLIEARNRRQILVLQGDAVGGIDVKRLVGLTQEGKGSSANINKGGDGKLPVIEATLQKHPIRVTYSHKIWKENHSLAGPNGGHYGYEDRRTVYNPWWMRR